MKEIEHRKLEVRPNLLDKVISAVAPVRAAKRFKARTFLALAESYYGASRRRRALIEWETTKGDADTDIIGGLPELRQRSRDLARNNPLAAGSINTKVTSIVGTGLMLRARIDRDILNMNEEEADAWEKRTEAEWRLWADSTDCDTERTLNFAGIQALCLRSVLENGDIFVLTPSKKRNGKPYGLQLQLIEADRVCNAENAGDTDTLAGGVKRDKFGGAPVEYHILKGHPGNYHSKTSEWTKIKAYGEKTGRKNILHLFNKIRVGQSRGVPDLAPVIEVLKQMGRYTESELAATVISSFFTVFVKSEFNGNPLAPMEPTSDIGGKTSDKDFKMGSAAILDLAPGEDINIANPGRPNEAFDPFILALSRQIGVALELPYEILVKHFTASYSAARAAIIEAWRFFMGRRKWLTDVLCKPVYELWMMEAVVSGRIAAPGFLTGDPLYRAAYLGSVWTGPARGQIDEEKEIKAAAERVSLGVSTLDEETAALTGGDWEQKHVQRAKEVQKRKEAGLETIAKDGDTKNDQTERLVSDRVEEE